MCGRYSLGISNIKKRFGVLGKTPFYEAGYNISPSTINPVVVRNSPNRIVLMKWGLIPFWSKDPRIGFRMINARCEGIENKPAFRKPIRFQRCLVPTTGFYEWKRLDLEGAEEKIPFYIKLRNQEVFSFAGVYDVWRDAEGKEIFSYAIVTTGANEIMSDIHNRMPVILDEDSEQKYLDKASNLSDILLLLKPFDSGRMQAYPISKLVNDPRNDSIDIIQKKN